MEAIKKGTWVSLKKTILQADERAEGIPTDTSAVPLVMWVNGFLENDAALGGEATIHTKMNRVETGILEEVNPTTSVNYGEFVPEILQIGIQARKILYGL
ncbi:MAG: 2-amino-4-oxopentanoate thiolase subunit OrtA [Defluviitaleaceae bacterium]|nr:2-amino-4-oxopentanoate thiolase subunit OrtA [Defluviitaleaceae bacterium]